MIKVILFALYILLLGACTNNEKEEPEGGPCTYETKIYPATVIAIENIDSIHADILFRITDEEGQLYRDSVSWYMENKSPIELARIEKESVTVGKKFKYTVCQIKTGSCNPHIESLLLEKFE